MIAGLTGVDDVAMGGDFGEGLGTVLFHPGRFGVDCLAFDVVEESGRRKRSVDVHD